MSELFFALKNSLRLTPYAVPTSTQEVLRMQAEVITHKTPARLVLAAQGEGLYCDIAHFIDQGFATHYHANIHVSMPQLLAVTQSGQYRAAPG